MPQLQIYALTIENGVKYKRPPIQSDKMRKHTRTYTQTHAQTHTYTYTHLFLYICMCFVCIVGVLYEHFTSSSGKQVILRILSEIDSHYVPNTFGLVPYVSKA